VKKFCVFDDRLKFRSLQACLDKMLL
jgi:hypothetical protein